MGAGVAIFALISSVLLPDANSFSSSITRNTPGGGGGGREKEGTEG